LGRKSETFNVRKGVLSGNISQYYAQSVEGVGRPGKTTGGKETERYRNVRAVPDDHMGEQSLLLSRQGWTGRFRARPRRREGKAAG